MGKIYESFDKLKKENKSIFQRLKGFKYNGMLKAIWDARQSEIDQLKTKLNQLEHADGQQRAQIQTLKQALQEHVSYKEKCQLLDEQVSGLERTAKILTNENEQLKKQNHTLGLYQASLEKGLEHKQGELTASQREIEDMIRAQDELMLKKSQLEKELLDYKGKVYSLKAEVDNIQQYSREYRDMNNKLSHEIIRLKRRLAGQLPMELN